MRREKSLLSRQISSFRKSIMLLGGLSLLLGTAMISQAGLITDIIDLIFVQKVSFSSILALLGILLMVMAIRAALSYGNGRIGLNMAARAKTSLRGEVLRKLFRDSLTASLSRQSGEKVSLALDSVDEVDGYFSQYMPRMVESAIIPIMILVVVFTQHAPSGWIMLMTAPFIPLFMVLVGLQTRTKSEEKFAELARFSGIFLDSLQGLVTLKLYGRVKRQQEQIERSSLGFRDATMGILRVAFTNAFMLELIVMLGIGLVSLELALRLLVFKTMDFKTAFFILLLVPEFYNLLKNMGTAFHSGRTSMGAARQVEAMLTSEGAPGVAEQIEASEGDQASEGLALATALPPTIGWRDLSFQYDGPMGFRIQVGTLNMTPGEQVAIVGRSGSGKTTLLHLISGLLKPSGGEVHVNGRTLASTEEASWFQQVSYITQHPFIFAGTFAENIAIGTNRAVSRQEMEHAAEQAGLAALITGLAEGYDTVVGEGGRGLSGGEKQRLALARAFLNRPAVILFDEPTVGLDLRTERILQRSIAELAQGVTMITVAHRLHTIQHADRILFMEDGTMIDSGSHEELLERLPQYAEMVNIQRGRRTS
ncbi:thiol reductant ABC exporter subunit CydD [Paenibacillus sp. JCM 10914]